MILHKHPYQPFIPEGTQKLIVGTLPPPRFSYGKLFKEDVNWCYGSKDGLFWPLMERIFEVKLCYDNSKMAVDQRKNFFRKYKIGICDIVELCERDRMNASDMGMKNIKFRDLLTHLTDNPTIDTLLLTGGNSKNGPEYLLRKYLKKRQLKLEPVSTVIPRIHFFKMGKKVYRTVSLISPSNAANRAIGANKVYQYLKKMDPDYTTFQFRLDQYKDYFF